ncbi:MAG TPA: hypothetical protein VGK97_02165, partial [Spongiibacteraceae bacterium]
MSASVNDNAEMKPRRRIRSFVLRAGRMTPAQQSGLELHWPQKGLLREHGLLNIENAFGRQA